MHSGSDNTTSLTRAGVIIALLSLLVAAGLAVRTVISDVRHVDIKVIPVIQHPGPELIEIEVVNVGHRSVQIVEAGFVLQNHDFFVPERVALEGEPRVVLPKVLSDGEGLQIYFAVPAIGHGENKAVKVFVEDAEGKRIVASLNDALRVLRQERGSSQ